ncbi:MAG: CBS domain-containing protein, partial [Psychroserpens sp.]|nr:CBS domain-containing protein [Psychroserpens sp.]
MKNTIAERVLDFLKGFPPFDYLSYDELLLISTQIKVLYLEKEDFIFKQHEALHDYFYVVKDGAVGIYRDNTLVDECDEGDIFGLRAVIRKDQYLLNAIAIEESIVYAIPSNSIDDIFINNLQANQFILASFATNTRNPYSNEDKGKLFANETILQPDSSSFTEVQSASFSKNPITCQPKITIKEASVVMSHHKVGSIIITEDKRPIGIITDKDLRHKIATGKHEISEQVTAIMSAPVITFPEHITIAEAQIAMLKHSISHLCITKDGTINSELVGILSEHDIIVVHGNNPSVLIKEIKRAGSANQLQAIRQKAQVLMKNYIEQHIPISFVTNIISAINDAITKRCIQLSLDEIQEELPTSFAWLAIGSQGRKEQLLLTDQDNALVYEDVTDDAKVKSYFLNLSKAVNQKLDIVGFELCPAEMMASNPKWCLSVSQWKAQFKNWITHPDEDKMMLCNIFFDYDLVYGNHELVDDMSDSIFEAIDNYEIFLNFMGRNALKNPPPLSFFRNFLVEDSGEHKDQFDIKARAIMPLVDAARLLILSHEIKDINSTMARYK